MTVTYLSRSEITTEPKGRSEYFHNYWWAYMPGKGFVFAGQHGDKPQCNKNRRVCELLASKLYPGAEVVQLESAYVPLRVERNEWVMS